MLADAQLQLLVQVEARRASVGVQHVLVGLEELRGWLEFLRMHLCANSNNQYKVKKKRYKKNSLVYFEVNELARLEVANEEEVEVVDVVGLEERGDVGRADHVAASRIDGRPDLVHTRVVVEPAGPEESQDVRAQRLVVVRYAEVVLRFAVLKRDRVARMQRQLHVCQYIVVLYWSFVWLFVCLRKKFFYFQWIVDLL